MSEVLKHIHLFEQPIPNLKVDGWKDMPIKENSEPLVPLGPFSDYSDIFTDSIYAGERFDSPYVDSNFSGRLITMFVREKVAEGLRKAQKFLPLTMRLVVFDTYRTLEVQHALYVNYKEKLSVKKPDLTNDELSQETQKMVSLPSFDPKKPSPHNTGGAVDLAIVGLDIGAAGALSIIGKTIDRLKKDPKNWQEEYALEMRRVALLARYSHMLEFGTPFDDGREKEVAAYYYEKLERERPLRMDEKIAQRNRRLLHNVMRQAGFEAYPYEWWHFNSKKSQMGAKTAGLNFAEYGATKLSYSNHEHEMMRVGHRRGSVMMHEGTHPGFGKLGPSEYFTAAKKAVEEIGDVRVSNLPKAVVIEP